MHNATRAPLLFVTGDKDHIAPPAVVEATVRLYRKSPAITEYKEFADRTHCILGQAGWQEVADYALDWAVAHARPAGTSVMADVRQAGAVPAPDLERN